MPFRVQVGEEVVEFPDGTSQEEMQSALEQRYGAPEQTPETGFWEDLKAWPGQEFGAITEGVKSMLPQPANEPAPGQPPYAGPLPSTPEVLATGPRRLVGGAGEEILRQFRLPQQAVESQFPIEPWQPVDPQKPTFRETIRGLSDAIRHGVTEATKGGIEAMEEFKQPLPGEEQLPRWQRGYLGGLESLGAVGTDIAVGGQKYVLPMMFQGVTSREAEQLKEQGYSDEGALVIGSLHGGAELIGEKTALGVLFKTWGGDWKKELAKFVALETGQETITESLQAWIDKMTTDQDMTWGEFKERYYDMLATLPWSLGGLAGTRLAGEQAERVMEGEGMPGTKKREVVDIFKEAAPPEDMTAQVAQAMAEKGRGAEYGEPLKEDLRRPVEEPVERQPDLTVHKPPVGPETQRFLDQALQTAGYTTMEEVPQNVRQSILADAVDMYEQSLVDTVASQTAFELRNLQLEEQRKTGKKQPVEGQKSRVSAKPTYEVGQTAKVALSAAQGEELAESEADVTIAKIVTDNEAIAAFDADIEPYGIKAGDRVKINTNTGELMTGFGKGAYAAARTGRIAPVTVPMERTGKTQFSKKKPWEMSADEWLEEYDKDIGYDEGSYEVEEAYANAYDYIDAGIYDINEAAEYVAKRTGLPVDDIKADFVADYGSDWTKDMAMGPAEEAEGYNQDWIDKATRDYYEDVYADQKLWDGTYEKRADVKKTTYDYGNWNDYRGGGYFVSRGAPAWALDGHLADDAEGEIISGGAESLMPDILPALRGEAITDPEMAAPMNVPEQNAIARVLRKMVDTGFPRAVIRSITSYGHQRERQYIAVSGAYAGADHSVRYSDYVLRDIVNNRESHPYQKALRFLMSHELSHAIEADRNEHTLSMDSPLFEISMDAISYTEETRSYNAYNPKTKQQETKEYTVRTPSVNLKKLGPIIRELVEVYNGDSDIANILSYPFSSLSSLANLKAGKKGEKGWTAGTQQSEINRIRAEAFAQLGAISFTYPELAKKHLPNGYKFIQEVKKHANHTDRSARRRALRIPFQLQGTRGSSTRVWSEAAGDAIEGRGEGRAAYTPPGERHGFEYDNDIRTEAQKSELKELQKKRDWQIGKAGAYFIDRDLTDENGKVESIGALYSDDGSGDIVGGGYDVFAVYGKTDEETGGNGGGILHTIYDIHRKGVKGKPFAWLSKSEAINEIKYVLSHAHLADVTTRPGKGNRADDEVLSMKSRYGDTETIIVLGDAGKNRRKIVSAYKRPVGATQYRRGPGALSRANKQAAVQRLVDRAIAITKHPEFDFKVIDNPHNPEFPQRLYREMLTQYSQGDTEVFSLRGLHTEAYGRPQMFIFSDNIVDNPDRFELDVVTTILHEGLGGHFTLRQYFGSGSKEFLDFMDSVYRLYSKTSQMQFLMEDLKLSSNRVEDRRLAAEEFLAEMAEETGDMDVELASTWDKLVHILKKMMRAFFRKMGMRVAAVENISSADVRAIMTKARRAVHQRGYSANFDRNMREVIDSNGTLASRRRLWKGLYESVEVSDEQPYITERQEKLPFYSQLHARAAVDAPMKGTPGKFKAWLTRLTNQPAVYDEAGIKRDAKAAGIKNVNSSADIGNIKEKALRKKILADNLISKASPAEDVGGGAVIDIDTALDFIESDRDQKFSEFMKMLPKWERQGISPLDTEPFTLTKKEIIKRIDHGKFKGYVQANAPQKMAHSDWKAYLRHAQRAFKGGPVKGEEVEWTGVKEFLDSLPQDAELTRQEFATWINMHKVLLKENYAPSYNFKTTYTHWGPSLTQTTTRTITEEPSFQYHGTNAPDDYMASEYAQQYYDERVEDVERNASEEFDNDADTSDYLDEEAYNAAVEEEAQRMADEWNEENQDEIDEGEAEERDLEYYRDDAVDEVDRWDYIDDDAYTEARDEAIQAARDALQEEADDYGNETASEEADETYRDVVTGWFIEGNDQREYWRVYNQDWDLMGEEYYSRSSAEEAARELMEEEGLLGERTEEDTVSEKVMSSSPKWQQFSISDDNYRELKFILPVDLLRDSNEFNYDTHFYESNIVVYVRLADIVWTVGEGESAKRYKALAIDELQSDWFQIGDITAYGEEAAKAEQAKWQAKLDKVRAKWNKHLEGAAANFPVTKWVEAISFDEIKRELKRIKEMITSKGHMTSFEARGIEWYIDGDGDIRMPIPSFFREENGMEPSGTYTETSYINPSYLLEDILEKDHAWAIRNQKVRALFAAFSEDEKFREWANWEIKGTQDAKVKYSGPDAIDNPWLDEMKMYEQKIKNARDFVPEVPLHQVYTAMVMKRMAQLAVDEGYEALVVAPGEVHSGRWDSDIYAWTNKKKKPYEITAAVSTIRNSDSLVQSLKSDLEEQKRNYRDNLKRIEKRFDQDVRPILEAGQRRPYHSTEEMERQQRRYQDRIKKAKEEGYLEKYGEATTLDWVGTAKPRQQYWNPFTQEWEQGPITPAKITEAERVELQRFIRSERKRARKRYHERIKLIRSDIKYHYKELRKAQDIVANFRGETLDDGQYYLVARTKADSILGYQRLQTLRKKEYWQPEGASKQELIEEAADPESSAVSLIDLNTNEGFKKMYEQLVEAFGYSQHYGIQGSLKHHTASAFMPTLIKQMKENPSGGIIFRRGAGLSGWYDRKLLSKGEGIRSLSTNMKVGHYGGLGNETEMAGVIIDDEFKKKWGSSQTQFARRGRPRSDDKRKILAKVGRDGTAMQRFLKKFEKPADAYRYGRDWFIQQTLDSGLPFKRMVEQLGETSTDKDPYVAWRLLAGDAPIIEDWLGVNRGTEGTVPFDPRDRLSSLWGKSLREIMEPVMQATETFKDFLEYIIARRAKELMRVGKEKLFTEEDIRYGLSLRRPLFDSVAQQIYRYNDSLVRYAVDGGFLSEEVAVKFRRYSSYIPFLREAEYEGDVGGKRGGVFKRLKGGTQHLRDPMQNLIDNTASIIHAVNRNAAVLKALHFAESRPDGKRWIERVRMPKGVVQLSTQRIIDQLEKQGVTVDQSVADDISYMQTFFQNRPIGDEKNRIIILKEEGKPVAVKVHDPSIWDALHAVAPMEMGLITDIMSIPAETIKTGIVMDPGFMGANLARDTLSAFIQAHKKLFIAPVVSSVMGMKDVATGHEMYKLYRALGAGFSDIWHGDSKEAHHSIKRLAHIGKFRPGTVLNPATYWRALRRLGTITETGTRLKTFEKLYSLNPSDPANALLAALEAREISVDFGLHGVSKTLRVLERITPFLNPAKQGLYKMGRTLGDQPLTTMMRGSPIMLMTFYLWMLNRDEEWYKDLEYWEKNHYWHADVGIRSKDNDVIPIRIPKPFEYGALFGSFPEALYQFLYDTKGEEALERVGSTIEDVFLLRGYPTALSLPTELYFNKSFFTDRPIVPGYLEGIDPRYQYGPFTTMGSRKAGEWTGFSPMKIEHSVRGIFGTLGMYTLMALDDPMTKLYGEARKPERHWWQMPGMRRFFSDPLRPNGKAMTEFYDTLTQYRMEQKTFEFLDYSQEYLETLDDMQSFSVGLEENLSKLMSSIRKTSREVRDMKDIPREEKRAIIDENTRQLRIISREWKAAREGAREDASK